MAGRSASRWWKVRSVTMERAEHVISDIGLTNTLACLDASVAGAWREQASPLAPGLGYVALYLGLEGDIAGCRRDLGQPLDLRQR